MPEPIYRWVCTFCDASGNAESSEMARLAVDVHVSLFHSMFHSPAREAEGGGGKDSGPGSSRSSG